MKQPKIWTAFTLDDTDPTGLHLTHKFLGEQPLSNIFAIEGALSAFFLQSPRFPDPIAFDQVEMFGSNKDIRVLTPTEYDPEHFFPSLRRTLDAYRKDDFDGFRPHITTPFAELLMPTFTGYVLMAGSHVVARWNRV